MRHLLILLASVAFTVISGETATPEFTPTAAYEKRAIEGFTVLVKQRDLEIPGPSKDALDLLEQNLKQIRQIVAKEHIEKLQKTTLWVEWEQKKNSAAQAHHSVDWLKNNGYNPEKVGGVEISNVRLYTAWTRQSQPMMVLHELAHYFHMHQLPREVQKEIDAVYEAAKESKSYDQVEHVAGGKRRAYALNNSQEYFAEATEAYFGKNDFFPFTHDTLKDHDPRVYALLEKVWGKLDLTQSVALNVKNSSGSEATLYWIDAENKLRKYRTIKDGESYTQNTFAGHRWVAMLGSEAGCFFTVPSGGGEWALVRQ